MMGDTRDSLAGQLMAVSAVLFGAAFLTILAAHAFEEFGGYAQQIRNGRSRLFRRGSFGQSTFQMCHLLASFSTASNLFLSFAAAHCKSP